MQKGAVQVYVQEIVYTIGSGHPLQIANVRGMLRNGIMAWKETN